MATKKVGTVTGHQDIEGNDIRVGDFVEDIYTGKTYIVNKYGDLFSETYGTRKLSGMSVRIVDATTENATKALAPEPEVEEILSSIPPYVPPVEVVPETEESVPEEMTPAEKELKENCEIFEDCIEAALEKQERLEDEAREFLTDEFLAALLRERGYTVKAEKEIRYIKAL